MEEGRYVGSIIGSVVGWGCIAVFHFISHYFSVINVKKAHTFICLLAET